MGWGVPAPADDAEAREVRLGYRTFKLSSGITSEPRRYLKSLGDPVSGFLSEKMVKYVQ
jgi:hypothetical protein